LQYGEKTGVFQRNFKIPGEFDFFPGAWYHNNRNFPFVKNALLGAVVPKMIGRREDGGAERLPLSGGSDLGFDRR
jgi:hypothetical protein